MINLSNIIWFIFYWFNILDTHHGSYLARYERKNQQDGYTPFSSDSMSTGSVEFESAVRILGNASLIDQGSVIIVSSFPVDLRHQPKKLEVHFFFKDNHLID
jgi:hypothetical protein